MPQSHTCTYCTRPAVTATTRRIGTTRVSVYSDPESGTDRDRSRIEIVRYCGVEHRPNA